MNPPAHRGDAIVAIATAPGRGAVGIVRVSGPALAPLLPALLARVPAPRVAQYGAFLDAQRQPIDQGLALWFPAPHSYTGEDVLELQAHGGPVVLQLLLARCLEAAAEALPDTGRPRLPGLRLAEPGEFTLRAFLNDKLDLAQAEAVADLIEASTEAAARSAGRSLAGDFSRGITALSERIVRLRTLVEATLDFPEEEIDFLEKADARGQLAGIRAALDDTLGRARQGALLREGLQVVLAGQPNVGKSSLLNALAGAELAIVTAIPGTTRDKVSQTIQIEGVPLHIVDTAGLRDDGDAADEVERIGIARSWAAIAEADAVIFLHDLSRRGQPAYEAAEAQIAQRLAAHGVQRLVQVHNKADLAGVGGTTGTPEPPEAPGEQGPRRWPQQPPPQRRASRRCRPPRRPPCPTATSCCRPAPAPAWTRCAARCCSAPAGRRCPKAWPSPASAMCRRCSARPPTWPRPRPTPRWPTPRWTCSPRNCAWPTWRWPRSPAPTPPTTCSARSSAASASASEPGRAASGPRRPGLKSVGATPKPVEPDQPASMLHVDTLTGYTLCAAGSLVGAAMLRLAEADDPASRDGLQAFGRGLVTLGLVVLPAGLGMDAVSLPLVQWLLSAGTLVALLVIAQGLATLLGRPLPRWPLRVAAVVLVAGCTLSQQAGPLVHGRGFSVCLALVAVLCAWVTRHLVLRPRDVTERALGVSMAAFALSSLARALLTLAYGGPPRLDLMYLPEPGVAVFALLYGLLPLIVTALVLNLVNARLRQRLHLRASTDELTGVMSRRAWRELAPSLLRDARARGRSLGVLMLDLDRFKRINDRHGHAAGDAVLVQAAAVLVAQLRAGAMLARYGGEEFVVALPVQEPAETARVAERLRQAVERHDWRGSAGLPDSVTISVGHAIVGADEDLDAALARADQALYRAKRDGRNRCQAGLACG